MVLFDYQSLPHSLLFSLKSKRGSINKNKENGTKCLKVINSHKKISSFVKFSYNSQWLQYNFQDELKFYDEYFSIFLILILFILNLLLKLKLSIDINI